MDKFLDEVKGSLAEGMIAAWIKFVGDRPPLEGYKAIVDELMFQAHYLDTNLRKSLSVAIIDKLRELGGNSKDIIVDAIRGVMASFTYRLRMYASSSYKIFGNHATAWRAKLRINNVFPRNKVQMDWKIGRIYSDGVLAKNFTENDERVCSECEELEDLGWTDPKNIKPIGQRLCGGSDRCYITYKYHGRNF